MRIYVWEFPVRFTHWINFLCILTLSLTGFYMGRPLTHAVFTKQYVMGWIRFIHFVAAYTFLMSFIIRIYWSLAGNKHANMIQWLPLTSERISDLINDIKCHLVLDIKSTCKVGHTSLGAFVFVILYIMVLFQILSGFAIYSVNHTGANWRVIGGWLEDLIFFKTLKMYHNIFIYIIISFLPIHLFMSWINNHKNKNRLLSSIFSGYKFMPAKDLKSPLSKK
jgi:Ni/Fe-hydrogenase 1 B-type cytochrome subunit